MNIRILSGAFIIEGNSFLMMKRADHKKIAPGMWAGVGGHAEPNEMNNPKATCLREIYEETGIEERHLKELNLRYIILRRNKAEITLIYYFIGFAGNRYFEDKTPEGKLYWIDGDELFNRPMSFEIKSLLEHYIEHGHTKNEISVGVVSADDSGPSMNWIGLDSWEGLTGVLNK